MRKRGLAFLGGVAGILFILSLIISDALIERTLERMGSFIVGARVEFSGVRFSLFRARLRWSRLQVTNPRNTWRNLMETGFTEVDLRFEPLLVARFLIDNMQIDSLRFDTPRRTNGALPGRATATTPYIEEVLARLEETAQQIPLVRIANLARIDIDSLIEQAPLSSPRIADSLVQSAQQQILVLDTLIDRLPDRTAIRAIRSRIDSLRSAPPDGAEEYLHAARVINQLRRQIDSTLNITRSVQQRVDALGAQAQRALEQIGESITRDVDIVMDQGPFPDFSPETVTRILLGMPLIERVKTILTWVGIARHHGERLRALFPPRETPPRRQGQTIAFSDQRNWPVFWIIKSSLSGYLFNLGISGTGRNIKTTPALIGEPITIELAGATADVSAGLSAVGDYRTENPRERIGIQARGIDLTNIRPGNSPLLPSILAGGQGDLAATLEASGASLTAQFSFSGSDLRFHIDQPDTIEPRILAQRRELASRIDEFSASASVRDIDGRLALSVSTDVASVVADALQQTVGPALETIRTRVASGIETRIADSRSRLQRIFDTSLERVRERAIQSQAMVEELNAELERTARQITRGGG